MDGNRSALCWFTGTDEAGADESGRQRGQGTLCKMKINIIHNAMLDILKPLGGCGSIQFEVSEGGGENWM